MRSSSLVDPKWCTERMSSQIYCPSRNDKAVTLISKRANDSFAVAWSLARRGAAQNRSGVSTVRMFIAAILIITTAGLTFVEILL